MANLAVLTITTAQTAAVTAGRRFRRVAMDQLRSMLCQGDFRYGSGGTSASFWVQTSLDGGVSWSDVFNFTVGTSSLRQMMNISAATPKLTPIVLTDGTLAANTAIDALVGDLWRIKYTTLGTYGGGTTMSIDLTPGNIVPNANE